MVGDIGRPMYESLPHRRIDPDDDTPWTLTGKITLSVVLAIAAIAGWHYYAHLVVGAPHRPMSMSTSPTGCQKPPRR